MNIKDINIPKKEVSQKYHFFKLSGGDDKDSDDEAEYFECTNEVEEGNSYIIKL